MLSIYWYVIIVNIKSKFNKIIFGILALVMYQKDKFWNYSSGCAKRTKKHYKDNFLNTQSKLFLKLFTPSNPFLKALRYQLSNIIETIEEILKEANDSLTKSESQSLDNEVSTFEFVLSLIIWFDIPVELNIVNKNFLRKKINIDVSTNILEGLLTFLKKI